MPQNWLLYPVGKRGIAPPDVPEFFYVCVSFNPTATRGVFVGFDKNAAGHSRMALPDWHVTDAEGFDRMLRCYLKPL